jgi:hypothetical protein
VSKPFPTKPLPVSNITPGSDLVIRYKIRIDKLAYFDREVHEWR